jgi:peptide/nickel transport system substrate-binding protein
MKTAALAATSALAAPRLGLAADAKTLRFIPQANLANLDPIWTTQYVVRNAGLLIWDTLYGVDDQLQPQPQMVDGHEVSPDFKTWTFTLRPGLKFHDGEPVRAKDVVASISRWMVRDAPMGGPIKKRLDALVAVDDRTFKFQLNQPYPKLLFALGKSSTPTLFIMPERVAATDPFKQITDYVGSGPMRFKRDEWVPGAKAIFERFDGYAPRPEKANWLAGGKRINFERIEWQIVPDAATASAALQNGEVDWWETALPDLSRWISPTLWAISARSASITSSRRSMTCAPAAPCRSPSARRTTWVLWSATTKRCGRHCPASSPPTRRCIRNSAASR